MPITHPRRSCPECSHWLANHWTHCPGCGFSVGALGRPAPPPPMYAPSRRGLTPAAVGAALKLGRTWEGIAAAHSIRGGGRGLQFWAKRAWQKAHPLPAQPPDVFALMAEPRHDERARIVAANTTYYRRRKQFLETPLAEVEAWLIDQAEAAKTQEAS
jgi:hypothetical protein